MVELVDSLDLGSNARACRFESCHPHQIRRRGFGLSFLFLSDGTRTHLNAARISAAGEGLTEPLYSLLFQGESKRKSSPVIRTINKTAIHFNGLPSLSCLLQIFIEFLKQVLDNHPITTNRGMVPLGILPLASFEVDSVLRKNHGTNFRSFHGFLLTLCLLLRPLIS